MTRGQLIEQIFSKLSYLCVGLDTDVQLIPKHLQSEQDAVSQFNRQIIDATSQYCVAYKINTAFYEATGSDGWDTMKRTVDYIPSGHFKIADAKRGDIGNSSFQYANAFFKSMNFDAITVAPYMGEDSIRPFLQYKDKWAIILALTSNRGAANFEMQKLTSIVEELNEGVHTKKEITSYLYERVIETVSKWGNKENLMFVVGATRARDIASIREMVPDNFLLVPGVGFQGGSLREVSEAGLSAEGGLLVNVSRAIIYAGENETFATEAGAIAKQYQQEMQQLLSRHSQVI